MTPFSFLLIPPNALIFFLTPQDGIKLCNTNHNVRLHFLRSVVSAHCWDATDCIQFGDSFTQWVTKMHWRDWDHRVAIPCGACLEFQGVSNLLPRLPRLHELSYQSGYLYTSLHSLPDLSHCQNIRLLSVNRSRQYFSNSLRVRIDSEYLNRPFAIDINRLPPNIVQLRIAHGVGFTNCQSWPTSLTSLQFYDTVELTHWPCNLQNLSMRNSSSIMTLPAPLPNTLTWLDIHLGKCCLSIDSYGFIPNLLTHLVLNGCNATLPSDTTWIAKCEHVTHFRTDVLGGPLILPSNVQQVFLPDYMAPLDYESFGCTIHAPYAKRL